MKRVLVVFPVLAIVAIADAAGGQSPVDANCATLLAASKDGKSSPSKRASAAREALECAQKQAALAVFNVTASEKALSTRELAAVEVASYAANERARTSEAEYLGMKWGTGFGFSYGLTPSIDAATIVAGTVRVESDQRQTPRAVFEFHHYAGCMEAEPPITRGCGPFLAVAASDGKLLSGVGLGWMWGWKSKLEENDGFSIGVGGVLDAKVKNLAKGFEPDRAPPNGETAVRFVTRSGWSVLLIATRTF